MNLIDTVICEVDTGLRALFAKTTASRPNPAHTEIPASTEAVYQQHESNVLEQVPTSSAAPAVPTTLTPAEQALSIRLMRVNHCGEVCAQALYQGQALVAKTPQTRAVLNHAAIEERDHLAWCGERIAELGGSTSVLNPIWYAGSFSLGVVAGLLGDKRSMGFLVETERQVEAHLNDHLQRLPAADTASRKILETMREDEHRHGQSGVNHGATLVPPPVTAVMRGVSAVMTRSTYWV
jgi:3-demethoxyubiquinol 3-hydroxylase